MDPDTGKETGCERVMDLLGFLTQAPFNVTTLEGLTINIREQAIGPEAITPARATATVFSSDLTRFNIANPPLILDADMGSPVKDLHGPPATISSSGMPALVGRSIGSPFHEEERKRIEEEKEEEEEEAGLSLRFRKFQHGLEISFKQALRPAPAIFQELASTSCLFVIGE